MAGVAASPLPGPSGNVEFFVWLRRGAPPADPDAGARRGGGRARRGPTAAAESDGEEDAPVSRTALLVTHTGRGDSTEHARTVART